MTEEWAAARLVEIDAMEARVMAASNKEDALGAEITRLIIERGEARAESDRLRAALVEVDRHIGCLSHLAAGRACEVITRALHPDAPAVAPATLGAGPRDADGREVTP